MSSINRLIKKYEYIKRQRALYIGGKAREIKRLTKSVRDHVREETEWDILRE